MADATTGLFAAAETGQRIAKDDYEERLGPLRVDLLNLQYDLRSAGFSVILLIVGDDRPGCIDTIRKLHDWLDARYLVTRVFPEPTEEERSRPWNWRYWMSMPGDGRIGIFLGAWARDLVLGALDANPDEANVDTAIHRMQQLERELVDDRTLLLKFWLHLPRKDHEKRIARAKKDRENHLTVDAMYERFIEDYDRGLEYAERVIRRTSIARAPWNVLGSGDARYRHMTIAGTLRDAIASRLGTGPHPAPAPVPTVSVEGPTVLDSIDLSASLERGVYEKELQRWQAELNRLSREARAREVSTVIVFEGVDAAGKGGAIRRCTAAMPVENYEVIPVAAPTDEERRQHYLWRFWRRLPRNGAAAIFDRSWYGRVLVERVEGFASDAEWSRAYAEIVDFEEQIHAHGTPVVKFWLHIDPEEQLVRFEARARTPYKKYKLSEDDYRNREKWPLYERAVHDMVTRTSTDFAPWHLVAANDKRWARVQVLRNVCEALAARLDAADGGAGSKRGSGSRDGKKRKKEKKRGKD